MYYSLHVFFIKKEVENLGQHLTSWSNTVFFRSNIELSGSFHSHHEQMLNLKCLKRYLRRSFLLTSVVQRKLKDQKHRQGGLTDRPKYPEEMLTHRECVRLWGTITTVSHAARIFYIILCITKKKISLFAWTNLMDLSEVQSKTMKTKEKNKKKLKHLWKMLKSTKADDTQNKCTHWRSAGVY